MGTSHQRIFFAIVIALSLVWGMGCSDEPDREWAEKTYKEYKPKIDEIEQRLDKEYQSFDPPRFEARPTDPEERKSFEAKLTEKRNAFDEAALKIMKEYPSVIGWEMTYSFPEEVPKDEDGKSKRPPKDPIPYSFAKVSDYKPAWKPGTVRASRRDVAFDRRDIGWGMYMVPGKERKSLLGMEANNYFPGLEVDFSIPGEASSLDIVLFIVPNRGDEESGDE